MTPAKKTGNPLLILIVILYAIWYFGLAFYSNSLVLHAAGILATILFIFRIVRGDD
jgi:hypothetical protein